MTEADRIRRSYHMGYNIPKPEPLWEKIALGVAVVAIAPIALPVVVISALNTLRRRNDETLAAISRRTGIPVVNKIPESDEHGE